MAVHLSLVILGFATGLVAIRYLYSITYQLFFGALSQVPGPKLWAISDVPYALAELRGDINTQLLNLHEQYGHVVRIGPQRLSYTTEAAWRDVFAIRQGHQEFMKAGVVVPSNGVTGILQADRTTHARYRRSLAHAFSERGLREQESRVVEYVDLLVQRLTAQAKSGPQDLVQWFNWTTFDLIGDLAFGESFGCLENVRPHPWIEAVFGNLKYIVYLRLCRQMGLSWLMYLIIPKAVVDLRVASAKYSADKIAKRLLVVEPRGDFLDHVLIKSPEEGGMTVDELESNAQNIVLGGSETTATLLSGVVHLLLTHPDALAKVQSEVRSHFATDTDITIVGVNKLHYMLAVLQEAMRVYPPVPAPAQREVPAGGELVAGLFLPEKTILHMSLYVANHLSANFARPHEFLPERWLLSADERGRSSFAKDNHAVCQPFSVGARNCIGRNLAYAEMRLMLAKILYNFDISFPTDRPPQLGWLSEQRTWALWEKSPLWVKLQPHH